MNWTGQSSTQAEQGSSPLLSLQPQVSYRDGQRVVAWEATPIGQQLATGFSALGFRVSSQEDGYLLHLDDESDQLLLRLYDLTTRLRWHAPQRQLLLFDTLPPVTSGGGR